MSETTQDLLRRGLELVEYEASCHKAREHWEGGLALDAVAAVVRRELEAPATGDDVRARVAKEVYLWEATRFSTDESWALRRWREESDTRRELYFNVADRILALLRSDAQGEDRWEDLVFRPIVEAYNEAQRVARRGGGGGE